MLVLSELEAQVTTSMAMVKVEDRLAREGWGSVKLDEKPLYGKQNELPTLEKARAAMNEFEAEADSA